MEKKTIGQFIAILRKANGMTQKDLAEKLNVSDKAVSRWERDECAPDLSLIPVIAEIFQVTTDELLRGERKNIEQTQNAEATEEKISPKSEKQVERILAKSKTGMTIGSILSLGIAVVGLLAAFLCNFAFLKSYLGFFVGCVFFLGAGACLVIFHILALASIQGGEIEGMEEEFAKTKQFFNTTTFKTAWGLLLIFVATLPFIVSGNSHWGLTFSSWFDEALVFELLTLIFCGIFYLIFKSRSIKKQYPTMSTREKEVYDNNKALRKKLCKRVVPFVAILLVLSFFTMRYHTENFIIDKPTTITSIEEFKELMEQPIRVYGSGFDTVIMEMYSSYADDSHYSVLNILKPDGTVADTFRRKNDSVYKWSVEWDGDIPTFKIIEESHLRNAGLIKTLIFGCLLGADALLVIFTVISYFKKRERL